MNYKYWESKYPDYCVVRKEGFYYTARNGSAEILNEILDYKLYKSGNCLATGGTSLDNIVDALIRNRISYVIIEDDEVTDKEWFEETAGSIKGRVTAKKPIKARENTYEQVSEVAFEVHEYSESYKSNKINKQADPEYEEFKKRCHINLNEQQDAAVQTVDGAVLLLAVPGSGKTTVLVSRLGYMVYLKNIDPKNILTITYTVAATNDMRSRFTSMFGDEYADSLEFRTINGISQKILMHYGRISGKKAFDVADKEASDIIKQVFRSINDNYATENDMKNISTAISFVKNMRLEQDEIDSLDTGVDNFPDIYKAYNAELKKRSLIDYDDQMVYALMILEKFPEVLDYFQEKYMYICVDEAQDTSKIQHDLINLLASKYNNLFMVGDEDQSIYGFRAAYPQALLSFEKIHQDAKILLMESNYRSNDEIVSTADKFIQKNQYRHVKHMNSTREKGGLVKNIELNERRNQYNYLLKMAQNCNTKTAVLYRNNESAIPLIDLLDKNNILYRLKKSDMVFFSYPVVTDILDILRFSINPTDEEIFMRIYYKIGASIKKIYAQMMINQNRNKRPILQNANDFGEIPFYIRKSCRETDKTLMRISLEPAGKAVFMILNALSYRDYISEHNMDSGKADIIQILANNSESIGEFLDRINELKAIIEEGTDNADSNVILSTIHSSKGLEYDKVYLMDMINGILPSKGKPKKNADESEKILYEEERRLFYVAMTRAKNELHAFTFKNDDTSAFCKELFSPAEETNVKNTVTIEEKPKKTKISSTGDVSNNLKDILSKEETEQKKRDFEMGVIVRHSLYGRGVITERRGDYVLVLFDNDKVSNLALDYVVRKGILMIE